MRTVTSFASVLAAAVLAMSVNAGTAAAAEVKAKPRKGMELPAELQTGTSEARVTHRKLFVWPDKPIAEMLQYDPYRVVDFRRGWSKGASNAAMVFGRGWTFQWAADAHTYDYSFDVVTAGEGRWTCSCAAASTSRGTFFEGQHMGVGIPGHGQARLACVLQPPDDAAEWRLEMGVDLKPALLPVKTAVGWARHAGSEIELAGTERQATWGRAPGRLVGVVMSLARQPVAAVDLVPNPGVVFGAALPPGLRDPVAVVGAALLLFPDELDPFPTGPR